MTVLLMWETSFWKKKPKLKPNGIKLKNLLNLSLNALSKGDAGTFI